MIKQVSTSACKTVYSVNGCTISLWIITGGTPAVDFDSYGFCQRYPKVARWSDDQWQTGLMKYRHQSLDDLQGPTANEVLPNGEKDLIEFVEEFGPLREKRMQRYNGLPTHYLKSKRFHDLDNCCYFWVEFQPKANYIGSVTLESRYYCGRCEDVLAKYGCRGWRHLAKLLSEVDGSLKGGWETLNDEQYNAIVQAMKALM